NEQETYRRGSSGRQYDAADSILSERAARELYLKPFEMLVKEADIACLMTSFNKVNGVFAGGNKDLCTHILKEEWGYRGVVVTDWGDMDIVVNGADAVAAGNDVVMPGGPPVIAQILRGYQEGRVSREAMEEAVTRLLYMTHKVRKGGRHGK
ncbi:MAG: beta-glucosidase, partial [Lachnospiraceae bacterium]|nr:beta-glucosidase [Lachnospiraceae bacterium]